MAGQRGNVRKGGWKKLLAVGRSDYLRMVLQQAASEEGNMGGEEKVVQEAGHPGWDASR